MGGPYRLPCPILYSLPWLELLCCELLAIPAPVAAGILLNVHKTATSMKSRTVCRGPVHADNSLAITAGRTCSIAHSNFHHNTKHPLPRTSFPAKLSKTPTKALGLCGRDPRRIGTSTLWYIS